MTNADKTDPAPQAEAPPKPPKIDWRDPNVPAGDAPPLPRWPLVVSAIAFGLWICFLAAMAVVRYQTTKY